MNSKTSHVSVPRNAGRRTRRIVVAGLLLLAGASAARAGRPAEVDFEHHVWPIFQARCLACHGPGRQRASLRVDSRQALLAGGDTGPAVVPGKPEESYLFELVSAAAPHPRMPPKGEPLSSDQVALLRRWIVEGAKWPAKSAATTAASSTHWAFQSVVRPPVPHIDSPYGDRQSGGQPGPIDAFLLDRLSRQQLQMAPPADAHTFIRRVTLDLWGLPPAPEEVEAFVRECAVAHAADSLPDAAVARLVDSLLDSPRYGERWAQHWLDVIRYADTGGYEKNALRPSAWPYRDYVIQAFNADTPYPRFLLEQLAGDTVGVDAATGFLVTAPFPTRIEVGQEASAIAQARYNGLDEVLQNLGSAVLGTTVGCARCHDHMFDPISLRDYYRLVATFGGLQFVDRPWRDAAPLEQVARVERRLADLREDLARFSSWRETEPAIKSTDRFRPIRAKWVRLAVTAAFMGSKYAPGMNEIEVWEAPGPTGRRRNVAAAEHKALARSSGADRALGARDELLNDGKRGSDSLWVASDKISEMPGREVWFEIELPQPVVIDGVSWTCDIDDPLVADRVPLKWRTATEWRIDVAEQPGQWRTVATEDRSDRLSEAEGRHRKELEEQFAETAAKLWDLTHVFAGAFKSPGPMHVLRRGDPQELRESVGPGALDILGGYELPGDAPEAERRLALARWLGSEQHPLTARVLVNRVWRHHFGAGIVDTPSDFGTQGERPTHPELLDWLAAEFMEPTVTPPLSQGRPGGVASVGSDAARARNAPPPNPPWQRGGDEVALQTGGEIQRPWSLKHLHRLICTSMAYRQSSRPNAEAAKVDADARLLWRFPPRRLEGEVIRDSMLCATGVLDLTMGGPAISVFKPPVRQQSDICVWEAEEDPDPATWRRAIYLLRARGGDDGVFTTFDVPDCGQVRPKRSASTTPLQALNLFNSPFAVRQAQLLAERVRREAGSDPARQIDRAFLLTVSRSPHDYELAACRQAIAEAGLEEVCRALFNSNQFLFLE